MNHIQQLSCFIGKAMYVSEFVCDKDYDALHIIVCIFKYLNAQYSSRLCVLTSNLLSYSKTERRSTYECVRCLKAFMNNKVSSLLVRLELFFLSVPLCHNAYLSFEVVLTHWMCR